MNVTFPSDFFATANPHFDLTLEEFHTFHSIDRKLYYNLVMNLRRDPTRSLHVMALFLWLERENHNYNLVLAILTFPISYLNTLADEADIILSCVENDCLYFPRSLVNKSISSLQSLVGYRFSLAYFQQHRQTVVESVKRIAGDVCLSAFHDIMRAAADMNRNGNLTTSVMKFLPYSDVYYYSTRTNPPTRAKRGRFMDLLLGEQSKKELNDEISELIKHLPKEELVDESQVPPDERTIFLTFSKGYPIAENEVWDYFVRKYGDVVESVFMHEVPHHLGQSLYARLVLRSASAMDSIINSKGKEKFSINGKHVWARKYVRK